MQACNARKVLLVFSSTFPPIYPLIFPFVIRQAPIILILIRRDICLLRGFLQRQSQLTPNFREVFFTIFQWRLDKDHYEAQHLTAKYANIGFFPSIICIRNRNIIVRLLNKIEHLFLAIKDSSSLQISRHIIQPRLQRATDTHRKVSENCIYIPCKNGSLDSIRVPSCTIRIVGKNRCTTTDLRMYPFNVHFRIQF